MKTIGKLFGYNIILFDDSETIKDFEDWGREPKGLSGLTVFTKRRIYINSDLASEEFIITLYHELNHVFLEKAGMDYLLDKKMLEPIVQFFASVFLELKKESIEVDSVIEKGISLLSIM